MEFQNRFRYLNRNLIHLTNLKSEKEELLPTDVDSDYFDKFRDYKYNETVYELLTKQFESAKLDESREGNVMQVVDLSVVPEKKSKPRRGVISVAASLIGLILTFMYVLARTKYGEALVDPGRKQKIDQIWASMNAAIGRKA